MNVPFETWIVAHCSKKLSEKTTKTDQAVEVEEVKDGDAISRRRGYKRAKEKHFVIRNVSLPVYFSTKTKYKKLIIDFDIKSSNRYIKAYFDSNLHLVKDKLNNSLEPISVSFPLNDEGKMIIKNKIKREMNELILDTMALFTNLLDVFCRS